MTSGAVRRLIALLAGIAFFAVGVWLIVRGISATGTLDIKSALVSGTIQTGSAGLIIVFLATFIIIFASVGSDDAISVQSALGSSKAAARPKARVFYIAPTTRRIFWVLCAILLTMLSVALLIPSISVEGQRVSPLEAILTGSLFVLGLAAIAFFVSLLLSLFGRSWDEVL